MPACSKVRASQRASCSTPAPWTRRCAWPRSASQPLLARWRRLKLRRPSKAQGCQPGLPPGEATMAGAAPIGGVRTGAGRASSTAVRSGGCATTTGGGRRPVTSGASLATWTGPPGRPLQPQKRASWRRHQTSWWSSTIPPLRPHLAFSLRAQKSNWWIAYPSTWCRPRTRPRPWLWFAAPKVACPQLRQRQPLPKPSGGRPHRSSSKAATGGAFRSTDKSMM
mmetsp:Transcript_81782/g.265034  ORF Transcript_81782/g.265034 Transcript_81782/m.265034 type:complete len:223 (-) Transcript_81782:24-692(-)